LVKLYQNYILPGEKHMLNDKSSVPFGKLFAFFVVKINHEGHKGRSQRALRLNDYLQGLLYNEILPVHLAQNKIYRAYNSY
jgi:hypothetical protein